MDAQTINELSDIRLAAFLHNKSAERLQRRIESLSRRTGDPMLAACLAMANDTINEASSLASELHTVERLKKADAENARIGSAWSTGKAVAA